MLTKKIILSVLLVSCLCGCAITIPLVPGPEPLREQVIEGKGTPKILLMDISGVISEKAKERSLLGPASPSLIAGVREALQKAENDKDVAGVILRINSPGGTITATDIIHHEIVRFKERKKIPVYSCIMSVGTSGGYYIAAAADQITAHSTSITGSFAVIIMTLNIEGLMNKIGVSELTIKSGEKKDILSPFRPATPEEKAIVQTIVNQFHKKFVDTILARPGNALNRKAVESLADGRIYSAEQALEAKLIDRIGYLDRCHRVDEEKDWCYRGQDHYLLFTWQLQGDHLFRLCEESSFSSRLLGGGSLDWLGETQFLYLWRP